MRGLIIGRFQPVHNGHLAMLRDVDEMSLESIILGIGVNGNTRDERNPFSYDEVCRMIAPEIASLKTPFELYSIPDIHDSSKYAAYVEGITQASELDTVLVSGNDYAIECFTNYGKSYKVHYTPRSFDTPDGPLSATIVRDYIRSGGPWRDYVPESTRFLIESKGGDIDGK